MTQKEYEDLVEYRKNNPYKIKELVQGNCVWFNHYKKGELWYDVLKGEMYSPVSSGGESSNIMEFREVMFSFPVPIEDTGDGIFGRQDKAIIYMRYIRKHMAVIAEEKKKGYA